MRMYFSGIGGVGIGPLAEIALDAGYAVIGSDPVSGLMTEHLVNREVQISQDQSGDFLRESYHAAPIDWFVYTSALPDNHPELALARELGIRTAKRDELLAEIIKEKHLKLIAVAGTHGKTTTTGMLVWALKQLGIPVSYSVGTTLAWGPSGHYDPNSEYFIYECDEFDRNFLHFSPELSLVTNIEHDHADTYPTSNEYFAAFETFLLQSQSAILWEEAARSLQGIPESVWVLHASDVAYLQLAGEHNRHNGTLVLKALERLHISSTRDTKDALESFPGTSRRFEKLADNLYSDYGHHPSEITATLQLAREINNRVVLIYQPHQNIRQQEIRELYTDEIFATADEVYWLPTYLSREDPNLEVLSPELLTDQLRTTHLHLSSLDEELWLAIQSQLKAGNLVLCMGAGSIDGWIRKNLNN